jgi:hypothetical protein
VAKDMCCGNSDDCVRYDDDTCPNKERLRGLKVPSKRSEEPTAKLDLYAHEKKGNHLITALHNVQMSTDLPAADLGEALANLMQAVWRKGYDPVLTEVRITFS